MDEEIYSAQRRKMVKEQLAARSITDARILAAMRSIPRHRFVPPDQARYAYTDGPLSIGHGQTISQPYIVAFMTQTLGLTGSERVLEVGTGSGYQAAVLSMLAREVHTVERVPSLAENAALLLDELGCRNVTVHCCDGSPGWPEAAPFQAIIVTAAAPNVPQPLLDQLADLGRLIIPVGAPGDQYLELWTRRGTALEHDVVLPVAFVPLRGKLGWMEDDR